MAKAPIRKPRKKVCLFCQEKITYVDYKDTGLLRKFISDRGKIRARRVTGNCAPQAVEGITAASKGAADTRRYVLSPLVSSVCAQRNRRVCTEFPQGCAHRDWTPRACRHKTVVATYYN